MRDISEIKDSIVVIDTNIIIHYSSDGFKERSQNPLGVLSGNNNDIIIPAIVGFELIKAGARSSLKQKYLNFLNHLPTPGLTKQDFQNAAIISLEYNRLAGRTNIKIQDLLIAGFVVSRSISIEDRKTYLLTSDRSDFCEPVWDTISRVHVESRNKSSKPVILYLLEFNKDNIKPEYQP